MSLSSAGVGVIETLETLGAVLEMVAVPVAVTVPPSLSIAVAVQVMMSPLEAVETVRVRLELAPRVVDPLVQA